ncbi:DUF6420 family protein [Streptomyces californicus]|uniref:DUF6420 family protein n=1 Tax=Streptomyces californicus TaxID=67351 RepID=UPI0036FFD72A
MSEDRGVSGPHVEYDGLPVLRGAEVKLPLTHPHAPVEAGRFITPGGGRLTIGKAEGHAAHLRVTLDRLGCPAQCVEEKDVAFRRLAPAVEGYCVHAGRRHRAVFMDGVFRHFELRDGAVSLAAFVRVVLAIELEDLVPADRIVKESEAQFAPLARSKGSDGAPWGLSDHSRRISERPSSWQPGYAPTSGG